MMYNMNMTYRPNKNIKDITGNRYGHLVVTCIDPDSKARNMRWLAQCDCGNIKSYRGTNLKSGATTSCSTSCIYSPLYKHGGTGTPEYSSYNAMIARCYKPNTNQYDIYGGRGITVCQRWLDSFTNFLEDMGKKPTPRHQINRLDSDKNYEPKNCVWSTVKEQANNRRSNTLLDYDGKEMTISQWADSIGMKQSTLSRRLHYGWTIQRAITEPVRERNYER